VNSSPDRISRGYKLQPLNAAVWFVFCALLSCTTVRAPQDTGFYPGQLRIVKAQNLSEQQRRVEARFAAYLESQTNEAIARYHAKYGTEINTDNVRELSIDYAPGGMDAEDGATVSARTRWGDAVHEPASALTREIYRRALLKETPPNRRRQVVFVVGGAGVGKTTSIRMLTDLRNAVEASEIVYDTIFAGYRSALERINQALEAGRMASLIIVYRDPIDSFVDGLLPRAKRIGRTLPLDVFVSSHVGALETFPRLADTFKDDRRLSFAVIDNSLGVANAKTADVEFIKATARKFSREALKLEVTRALEQAYEKGKKGDKDGISEMLYRAIKGDGA